MKENRYRVESFEIILAQFIRKHPPKDKKKDQADLTSLGIGGYPAAYTMAKGICPSLRRSLESRCLYLFLRDSAPDTGGDDEAVDVEDLEKAHHLINELYLASPHILSSSNPSPCRTPRQSTDNRKDLRSG